MSKVLLVAALTAFIASAHAANPEAGREKSRTCAACHGPEGKSPAAQFPKLAGQHYDYLVKAMTDYKRGTRKNAIMQAQVANLSIRDIEDIAAFYSEQTGLFTRKNPYLVRDR